MIEWADAARQLLGFVGVFLAVGAAALYFVVLSPMASRHRADATMQSTLAVSGRRAAWIGIIGTVLALAAFAISLPKGASRAHVTVMTYMTTDVRTMVMLGLQLAAIIGFVLAAGGRRSMWALAALGAVGPRLVSLFMGNWGGIVNSMHWLFGAFWIGTLFVLAVAGVAIGLGKSVPRERRGPIVAEMVNRFSPFALACGGVLATFGVITAWRHLYALSDLWTTSYGNALIAKLVVVGIVAGLGAWNWRRLRPQLGTEDAAIAIGRSARFELIAGGIVLIITSILVSLPSPPPPVP